MFNYSGRIFLIFLSLLINFDETCASLFPINACENESDYPFWFVSGNKCWYDPNVVSVVPAMIARHGYELETHEILTPDGYILPLFRVLPKGTPNGEVIFMQHGITTDSSYFCDKRNTSHAFYFSDAGYDVWLGNARGSTYAKEHVYLSIDSESYWNFSLDALAIDLRLQLQLVVNVTRSKSIFYLGYSMGGTLGFMYFSEFPQESKKIVKAFIAIAPVVYMYDAVVVAATPFLMPILKSFYRGGLSYGETKNRVIQDICIIIPTVCRFIIEFVFGKSVQFPAKYIPLAFNSYFRGAGVYMLDHYVQYIKTNDFRKYDWGRNKNQQLYGSPSPPLYNLSQIQVPVFIYWGKSDLLTSEMAISRITSELGPTAKIVKAIAESEEIPFSHIDFTYAKDLRKLLLDVILKDIQTVIT